MAHIACEGLELSIYNVEPRNVDPLLKTKLQRLETQKRAALDAEAN